MKELYRLHGDNDFCLQVQIRLSLVGNHECVFSLFPSVHLVGFMLLLNLLFLLLPPLAQVNLLFVDGRVAPLVVGRRRARLNPDMSASGGVYCTRNLSIHLF